MGVSDYFSDEEIKTLDKCITYASGRRMIVSKISREHESNWQMVETPHRICREMLGLIPEDAENFVIFFALEFLEVLVKELGFEGDRVIFIADNELEANVAVVLYGVQAVVYSRQDVSGIAIKELLEDTGMKFGKVAVVGNPPYQIEDGGHSRSSRPIYHLFVEAVIDYLKPNYFSFIIPSRWMVSGKGLTNHRERMMHDKRIKKIIHFPGEKDVFETASIKGGVSYFLWVKSYQGNCEFISDGISMNRNLSEEDIIIQDNKAVSILNKVKNINSLGKKVLPSKPFGLRSFFSNWKTTGIKCINQGKKQHFVSLSDFTDRHNVLNKWKVCTSKARNTTKDHSGAMPIFTNFFIIEPGVICTETYIVVNYFNTKTEAENFVSYMKTKFFRFMLGLRTITQDINKEKFAWVPDLENYSKPWTDEELYRKFELTDNEIKHIESKIKPIGEK